MLFRESTAIALGSLRVNKLRTFLTLLGNIVAVSAVIAVVSIIDGMNRFVREEIAGEGGNIITLAQRNELEALGNFERYLESLRNPRLTLADYDFVRGRLDSSRRMGAEISSQAAVAAGDRRLEGVRVDGWTEGVAAIRGPAVAAGRLLAAVEVERAQPVAVLGADVAERLFPAAAPLGGRIRVGGQSLRVVGVLAERAAFAGEKPNLRIIVPIGVFQKLYGPRSSISIPIQVASVQEIEPVIQELTWAMRLRHRLRPDEPDDFAILTSGNLIKLWESISRSIFAALIALTSVALIVGGIVIMNVMLVGVSERTREIGVRKALGARRSDLLWQFLVEAATLSGAGGVIGIGAGLAAAVLVARLSPLPYAVEPWSVALGFLATVAVGLFFGLYPASRAARLHPVEALRHE